MDYKHQTEKWTHFLALFSAVVRGQFDDAYWPTNDDGGWTWALEKIINATRIKNKNKQKMKMFKSFIYSIAPNY